VRKWTRAIHIFHLSIVISYPIARVWCHEHTRSCCWLIERQRRINVPLAEMTSVCCHSNNALTLFVTIRLFGCGLIHFLLRQCHIQSCRNGF